MNSLLSKALGLLYPKKICVVLYASPGVNFLMLSYEAILFALYLHKYFTQSLPEFLNVSGAAEPSKKLPIYFSIVPSARYAP